MRTRSFLSFAVEEGRCLAVPVTKSRVLTDWMEPKANLTLVTVRQSQWEHFFSKKSKAVLIRQLCQSCCLGVSGAWSCNDSIVGLRKKKQFGLAEQVSREKNDCEINWSCRDPLEIKFSGEVAGGLGFIGLQQSWKTKFWYSYVACRCVRCRANVRKECQHNLTEHSCSQEIRFQEPSCRLALSRYPPTRIF
jgi:hypothetical protein